ncbi:hypothetical protein BJ742DRAFT_814045 [Cladochytrium replicatum]|nr:hypothetical protein BJ742DRAFT_814045 [Cladochytrium replicatum]
MMDLNDKKRARKDNDSASGGTLKKVKFADTNKKSSSKNLNHLFEKKKLQFADDNHDVDDVDDNGEDFWGKKGNATAGGYYEEEEDDDDDDAGDDDEDLKVKKRRGMINMDDYASDDDPYAQENEEDEDMFGDKKPKAPKKGAIQYMSRKKITGERRGKATAEFTEDGITIEPFNMDQEMHEGGFDEDGHYVRKKDELAVHDKWLQGVSTDDIMKAKIAHEKQEMLAAEEAERAEREALEPDQMLLRLLRYMNPGEKILETMRRLRPAKQPKQKKSKNAMSVDSAPAPQDDSAQKKAAIEDITALCGRMMALGDLSVYESTYEQIVRKLRLSEVLPDHWMPGAPLPGDPVPGSDGSEVQWEYKWNKDAEEAYGPFSTAQMKDWKSQGMFPADVVIRQTGVSGEFSGIAESF